MTAYIYTHYEPSQSIFNIIQSNRIDNANVIYYSSIGDGGGGGVAV